MDVQDRVYICPVFVPHEYEIGKRLAARYGNGRDEEVNAETVLKIREALIEAIPGATSAVLES